MKAIIRTDNTLQQSSGTMNIIINSKIKLIAVASAVVLLLTAAPVVAHLSAHRQPDAENAAPTEAADSLPPTYSINTVKATLQDTLMAGCETHAATSLLQSLGYDIDIFTFADNYLECHEVTEDEYGEKYGPDMNSGFAGTAYAGWGVYAPAMAKCMNRYLSDVKSTQKAYVIDAPSLSYLCEEYIVHDVPVMIWATSDMKEPFAHEVWKVNYVDENAKYKIGEMFSWMIYEHCLVLCGYDEKDYFFSDSVAGDISHFEKSVSEKRFEQLGYQAIVVQ